MLINNGCRCFTSHLSVFSNHWRSMRFIDSLGSVRRLAHLQPRFVRFSSNSTSGSLIDDIIGDSKPSSTRKSGSSGTKDEPKEYNSNSDIKKHPWVHAKLHPQGKPASKDLLSSLKQKLYEQVVKANGGRYVNNQFVEYNGSQYKLSLTHEEQKALIPSVYVQSYRIKSSWKKTFMFLRMFRRMDLTEAISQCHFSAKSIARDVGEMLVRGSKDARKLGMNFENLHIDQIWVGKDGRDLKRVHVRGRGRNGIIKHPYVHVKAILMDKSVLQMREERVKKQLDKKLWLPLRNWRIKEDFVQTADYKW